MNDAEEAYAFIDQQPAKTPRHTVHPKCAQSAGFPALFTTWIAKAPRTASDKNAPVPLGPGTRPTKDRFLFPWESEMSDIEWAVATILKKKYPEIHREIVWAACEHGGFLEDADILAGPQPQQPPLEATPDAAQPPEHNDGKQPRYETGQSPRRDDHGAQRDDRKESPE